MYSKIKSAILSNQMVIAIFLFFVLTLIMFSINYLGQDEGSTLNVAWQLFNHRVLQKDFFEFISPGTALFVLMIWKIVGSASYFWVKFIAAMFYFLFVYFVIRTIRLYTQNKLAVYFALVLLCCTALPFNLINHNFLSSLFVAPIIYLLASYADRKQNHRLVLMIMPLLLALITFFLQTKGVAVFIATFICLTIFSPRERKIQNMFVLSLSYFLLMLTIVHFMRISLLEFVQYYFLMGSQVDYLDSSFYSVAILISEIVIFLAMLYYAKRNRSKFVAVLSIFQIFLFLSVFYNNDNQHFLMNLFPFLIFLSIVGCEIGDQALTGFKSYLFFAGKLLIMLVLVFQTVSNSEQLFSQIFKKSERTVFLNAVHITAGNVYFGPFLPGLYYTTGKVNYYSPYSNMVYCLESCQNKVLEEMNVNPPVLAINNYEMVGKYGYQKNKIDMEIKRSMNQCKSREGFQIYAKDCSAFERNLNSSL